MAEYGVEMEKTDWRMGGIGRAKEGKLVGEGWEDRKGVKMRRMEG